MTISNRAIVYGIALSLLLGGISFAKEVRELTWDDLIPEGELAQQQPVYGGGGDEDLIPNDGWKDPAYDNPFSTPVYPSGVVEELNGVVAKLPGFVVPLAIVGDGKVKDFLLVPYFGACIHYPPPPPNQVVYVKLDEPIDLESTWDPIWATGELKTEFHGADVGSAAYTMVAQKIEEYEY